MGGPYDSSGSVVTDEDDKALLWVTGSSSLDTPARSTIKHALRAAGIKIVQEKLLAAGSTGAAGAVDAHSAPRLVFLVSTVAGTEEGLEELLSECSGPNSLVAAFGNCFTISSDPSEIDTLFPPAKEQDPSVTATSDSILTPEHERRVFTFVSEEADEEYQEQDEYEGNGEGEDDDVVAEQLISTSKPLQDEKKTPLRQSMPASSVRSPNHNSAYPRSPSAGGEVGRAQSGSVFKGRKTVSALGSPATQPRLSKAAALRMGITLPEKSSKPVEVDENGNPVEAVPVKEAYVPGVSRRDLAPPKSLAKPSVSPRQNRASALRTTEEPDMRGPLIRPPTSRRESLGTSERSAPFIGLPGFAKQRKQQPPSPAKSDPRGTPGQNRAAMLRQNSASGHLSPLPQPSQPRKAMTTAERAAANKIERVRTSVDHGSSFDFGSGSNSNLGSVRSATSSRPSLSREASEDLFAQESGLKDVKAVRSPSRSPSIAPRANKAAELRLAAQRLAKGQ